MKPLFDLTRIGRHRRTAEQQQEIREQRQCGIVEANAVADAKNARAMLRDLRRAGGRYTGLDADARLDALINLLIDGIEIE